jgi:hypothetical protein
VVLSWPDEQVTATMSQNEPPVKVVTPPEPTQAAADAR